MSELTATKQRCINAIKKFSTKCDEIFSNFKHEVDTMQKEALKEVEAGSVQKDQQKLQQLEHDIDDK